jgi:CheY-like chemotaxis protein
VIDDSDIDRELVMLNLRKVSQLQSDLTLDSAADGREALQKLQRGRFALVVLDWNLPLYSGGTVLRLMRQNGLGNPVVVVSGMQRHEIDADIESMGAAFLNKDDLDATHLFAAMRYAEAATRRLGA